MKKILLICVSSQSVINFRLNLIKDLLKNDYQVSVVAMDNERESEIRELGCDFYYSDFTNNRQTNPFKVLKLKKYYKKLIKQVKPDIVFTFMLKPNVLGATAAKCQKVCKIYSMVEGAGDVFIYNTFKWKIIRFIVSVLLKRSFKGVDKVFFINQDDANEFTQRKLVQKEQCEIINGVGINLERFTFKPITNTNTFLMVARMLKTKGVMEYCNAAKIVKEKYPQAVFNYLGSEGGITVSDLDEYISNGIINYLGTAKDVVLYYEQCSVNVLPSYREGLGLVNAEAGAVGRPSITCDTIGTKDTVKDGYNGFLVKVGDAQDLAEKMIYFLENPEQISVMGANSRKLVEEKFDVKIINKQILDILKA